MIRISRRHLMATAAAGAIVGSRSAFAQLQQHVIGVMHALTGTYAFVGTSVVNGIHIAEDHIAADDMFEEKLRVIVEDTGSDRNQAVTLLNRFAAHDRALMVLGPTASTEALAAAPVANELRIPMLTTAISSEVLAAGPWSFKITEAPEGFMVTLARFAAERLGAQRCLLIYIHENDGATRQKNAFRGELEAQGVQVVSEEAILADDSDFTALSTKIASSDPDCVFIASTAEQSANLVIQARQAGLSPDANFVITSSAASERFLNAGGAAVEGSYLVADFVPGGMNDLGRRFAEAYQQRFGQAPDNWAAVGYTTMIVAARAIREAGPEPTRESVREALEQVRDLPAILGEGRFSLDEDRAPHYGGAVLTVQEGRFVAP